MAEKNQKNKQQWQLAFVRYYKILTALIVLVLFVLSYYFILQPKYEQVGLGGQYNITTLKSEVTKRQEYVEKLQQLTQNYQNINQTEIDRLSKILPNKKDIAGLFVQLQTIAEQNNLLLAGVTINDLPGNTIAKGASGVIGQMNVTVNLVGTGLNSYGEVKRFLGSVETNIRLFDVTAVYFSPDSPNYSISLSTYYYQPN